MAQHLTQTDLANELTAPEYEVLLCFSARGSYLIYDTVKLFNRLHPKSCLDALTLVKVKVVADEVPDIIKNLIAKGFIIPFSIGRQPYIRMSKKAMFTMLGYIPD